jgi:transglutaminase-like putative cysteine protease
MNAPAATAVKGLGFGLARDKADTLLLLAAAVVVMAPHADHLPAWISGLCALAMLWRAMITFRGTRMPPVYMLLPIALGAMFGIFKTYNTLLGREAGVAMLVILLTFKMLEMHAKRDLFVVTFLCFFLQLTTFFYAQGIGSALLMVVAIITILTAQLSFQYTGQRPPLLGRLRLGATILALATPLALALFVFFPRIQGPLWGMPTDAAGGRTGMSDSMSPGNLSSLAQSEETAFRVKFIDPAPPQNQMYWRGIVLSVFDGRTWNRNRGYTISLDTGRPLTAALEVRGRGIRHQVTLEPSNNRWLYALEAPRHLPIFEDNKARMTGELELRAENRIAQRLRYDVISHPNFTLQAKAPPSSLAPYLALPPGFNPQTMQAGAELRKLSDPRERINTVLRRFRRENFHYTLEPPLLGRDSVDEFLFMTKAGFCEHYASSFVFLMRAAGVPARVVAGYQGGEANPYDGFVTVRQLDAHAWSEVWLEGSGWTRIDPTAAVSPDRIQNSSSRVRKRDAPFGIESLGGVINLDGSSSPWLTEMRLRMGAINNSWNQWVLNYTPERQRDFLGSLRSALGYWDVLLAVLTIVAAAMLVRTLKLRARTDPIDALYSQLCLQLARTGLVRAAHEGPSAYAARVDGLAMAPEKKAAIARFLALYSAHKYGAQAPLPKLAATLRGLLNAAKATN